MADHKPLTNEDFRRLIATPVVRSGAATKAAPPASADGDAKDGGAEKKRRKFYKPKVKKDGAEDAKPKYRDRAAERREAGDEEEDPVFNVNAEDSVYLGGDLEHTHLVKGLDVALLEKVKAERRLAEAAARKDDAPDDDEQAERAVDSLAARLSQVLDTIETFPKPISIAAARFAPGRMAYLFDLSADSELPTSTVRASVSGAPRQRKSVAALHPALIDEVANVLTYGGAGNTLNARRVAEAALMAAEEQKELARAKDEEAAAEVPTEPRNKEDDIFAISSDEDAPEEGELKDAKDAGAYNPSVGTQPALGKVASGGYFGLPSLGTVDAGSADKALADALGVPSHLAALKRKVEMAAQAEERKKALAKKKEEEEMQRSRDAASRVSVASGGFQAYFQRRENDLAPKEKSKTFSDADLDFDAAQAKAPQKFSKVIVEEDDEVDDATVINTFKPGLEVFEETKKGKGDRAGKRARQGKEKQKINNDMDKISKIIKDKRGDEADTLLGGAGKKKKKPAADGEAGGAAE